MNDEERKMFEIVFMTLQECDFSWWKVLREASDDFREKTSLPWKIFEILIMNFSSFYPSHNLHIHFEASRDDFSFSSAYNIYNISWKIDFLRKTAERRETRTAGKTISHVFFSWKFFLFKFLRFFLIFFVYIFFSFFKNFTALYSEKKSRTNWTKINKLQDIFIPLFRFCFTFLLWLRNFPIFRDFYFVLFEYISFVFSLAGRRVGELRSRNAQ